MIIDDYEAIAKRLKEIQQQERRGMSDYDEDIDDCLIGNEEETGAGYSEGADIYFG